MLQGIKSSNAKVIPSKSSAGTTRARQPSKTLVTTDSDYCHYCKGAHFINSCGSFLKLDINSRINEARKLHLCLNCLKKDTIRVIAEIKVVVKSVQKNTILFFI